MIDFLFEIWLISTEAAPFLLLGFVFAGLIKAFLKESLIQKHLSKSNFSSVLKAALFGIPLPLCSCGVIPTAISLRKEGASKGATTSFLISTPESGVDSIAISYALLDPFLTVIRPISAFLSALFAGLIENSFKCEKDGLKEIEHINSFRCARKKIEPNKTLKRSLVENVKFKKNCCPAESAIEELKCSSSIEKKKSLSIRVMHGLKYAFFELMEDIAFHLLIGLILSTAIRFFVPDSFFEQYLSDSILSIFLMLIIGIPMYICATASTPIAAALILKGLSPGAALVFLLAGPATNLASIVVLQKQLGKTTLLRFISSVIVFSIVFGFATNFLYDILAMNAKTQISMHQDTETSRSLFQNIGGIILAFFILLGIWNDRIRKIFPL